MKKSLLLLIMPLLLAGCGQANSQQEQNIVKEEKAAATIQGEEIMVPKPSPFGDSEWDYYGFDKSDDHYQLSLKAQNATSVATSTLSGEYTEKGIIFYLKFKDDDIYARNVYDIGYDDNVELIFNLSTTTKKWVVGGSFHFLLTAAGKTYFQVAETGTGFGKNLDPKLHVVPGENYALEFHQTTEEHDGFNGFAARVFFAYGILDSNYEDALGDICVCLGMRNTHCFDIDSVWKSYAGRGCRWADASSFVNLDEYNEFD